MEREAMRLQMIQLHSSELSMLHTKLEEEPSMLLPAGTYSVER
jgi:hypothetical protein